MEIKIKGDSDETKNASFYITNDEMDNDNFVDVGFGEHAMTLSLDDLMGAISAFECIRAQRLEREQYET